MCVINSREYNVFKEESNLIIRNRFMKKINKILLLLFLNPILCSYTSYDSGNIVLEYHTLTKAIKILDSNGNNIESQQKDAGGKGHAYIVIHNTKSYSITVGNYQLSPNDSVSVGLWTSSAFGSSSSSLKFFGSSSSGSSESVSLSHDGIMYNYERVFYTHFERPNESAYLTRYLTTNQLNTISSIITKNNDNYNLVWYNCANFATEVWNSISEKQYYNGWFRSPGYIYKEITTDFPSEYRSGKYALKPSRICFYYNSSKNCFYNFGY